MSPAKSKRRPSPAEPPLVVGIGASAGGTEALQALLGALPGDCGMSFVVVLHVDPSANELLSEVLSKSAKLPVEEIENGARIRPGHIYTAPGQYIVGMKGGVPREAVVANCDYVGAGYGIPTEAMGEAVRMLAREEGILLDPVYSGKAMAGMIAGEVPPMVAHAAANAGIIGMARQLALEGAPHGIRAVTISPGPVLSPASDRDLGDNQAARDAITRKTMLKRFGRQIFDEQHGRSRTGCGLTDGEVAGGADRCRRSVNLGSPQRVGSESLRARILHGLPPRPSRAGSRIAPPRGGTGRNRCAPYSAG